MTLFDSFKSIVLLAILIYSAPVVIESIKKQYLPLFELRTQIGIIYITKILPNSYLHATELHSFFKDPQIKGIIIKIDCSECPAGTSQTIFHDIRYLKKEFPKPIITLVENTCTAGAYLIASACDYIIAPESSIIGGIGPHFFSTEQMENDETLINVLQQDAYQQLIKQIALTRKLSLTTTLTWAEGQIFTGYQAFNLGLINELGSMCTVIKKIKEKALIEGEIEWIENKKQNYFKDIPSISSLATNKQ